MTIEAYYTSDALARRCVERLDGLIPLARFGYILEPSAGAGAFLRALGPRKVTAIDLEPRWAGIEQGDFFRFEPPCFEPEILVLGNPPFGQRGALAMRFITRAMQFASVVAFILPRSFKKHTFLNRIDRNFHLADSFDCSEFVLPDGLPIDVKCVFQIWERRVLPRETISLPAQHEHFEMKHFHLSRTSPEDLENARRQFDFAIAQVGADFMPRRIENLVGGSYWFIKARQPEVPEVFSRLSFDFLDGLNTAHKSLSKKDIIAAYQRAL